MVEPISLKRARKARVRAEQRSQADANRAKFGQTRAQREQTRDEQERLARRHEDGKLEK